MTRETKIGLLVGLAFIIVIGILLSDHFSTATQPPQSLVAPTENVLESTRAPGASRQLPPLLQEIQPNRPIQIELDRNALPQGNDSITVGPNRNGVGQRSVEMFGHDVQGGAQANVQGGIQGHVQGNAQAYAQGNVLQEPFGGTAPATRNLAQPGQNNVQDRMVILPPQGTPYNNVYPTPQGQQAYVQPPLQQNPPTVFVPPQQGNQGNGDGQAREPQFVQVPDPQPFNGPMRQYAAQENDTVSRMALKFYGSKSKAHMDLIIQANPSLVANPNKVAVGQKFNIPVLGAAATGSATGGATGNAAGGAAGEIPGTVAVPFVMPSAGGNQQVQVQQAPVGNSGEVTYTTQSGDTLWSIARNECGSASPAMLKLIFEMNRGVLKSKDKVPSNVVLKLPPRAMASAGD